MPHKPLRIGHRVSVVIPAYSAGRYIGRAIRSALSQTHAPCEVIVVDDGSTDETAEVVKAFDVGYVYKPNGGAASARNVGIRKAGGDWIAFLDSDDCWMPNHLQALLTVAHAHNLDWCCGAMRTIQDGEELPLRKPSWGNGLIQGSYFENFFEAWGVYDCLGGTDSMVIKKTLIDRAGPFEESFQVGEDLDLWFRIAHANPVIGFSPEPTAEYHRRSGSLIRSCRTLARTALTLLDRHCGLAESYGPEHLTRFLPTAARLAGWVFREGVREHDRWAMSQLLSRYPRFLKSRRQIAFLIVTVPRFVQAYDRFVRAGVRTKSALRQLPHGGSHGITE